MKTTVEGKQRKVRPLANILAAQQVPLPKSLIRQSDGAPEESMLSPVVRAIELGLKLQHIEMTLAEQAAWTGISESTFRFRMKHDPHWKKAAYTVGKTGTDLRTTLWLIMQCQESSARALGAKR